MMDLRLPPQDIELEETILGTLLIQPNAILEAMTIIQPDYFYSYENQTIYKAILVLGRQFMPVDIITVSRELEKTKQLQEVGDVIKLSSLTDKIATSLHLEFHCRLLAQLYIRRELIKASIEIQQMSYDNNIELLDLVDFAQKKILDTTVDDIKSEPEHCGQIFEKVTEELEIRQQDPNQIGIPSGFSGLRWFDSHLIVFGARASMGKTWVGAVKFAYEATTHNVPTLVFSLEMSKKEMMHRFISLHTGIDSNDIRDGSRHIDWSVLEQGQRFFNNLPLYIDDNSGMSVFQLASKARKMKARKNIGLIIVDYLQLLSAHTKNNATKDQEVGVITKTLKSLAKDLDVPVIALAQINRGVEQRADKKPMMSDLRESGNIEQDADVVGMFYREYYYTQDANIEGEGEIIVRKNRHGKLGEWKFYHAPNWSKIENYQFKDNNNIALPEIKPEKNPNDDFEWENQRTANF